MELITLTTFNNEPEAMLFASFMESNGIVCFIHHNFSSTIYPIFNNTIGGIELKVRKNDLENAIKVLKDYEKNIATS